MAYQPRKKAGDEVALTGEVLAVVNFKREGYADAEPMYMIWTNHSWFWAWAETVDGAGVARPGGDPDPPPWPPGTPGG